VAVLSLEKITKHYGKIKALNEVSFEVPEGSVFGILGPNGSGKTTLLGIVMDVLKADSGSYFWFGKPGGHEQRKQIGTLLETPNFTIIYLLTETSLLLLKLKTATGTIFQTYWRK
jgi:ABC-2 type transport system ATP-binding protein